MFPIKQPLNFEVKETRFLLNDLNTQLFTGF